MCTWVSVSDVCVRVSAGERDIESLGLEDGSKMQDCVLPFLLFLCFINACIYNSCCSNCTSCC